MSYYSLVIDGEELALTTANSIRGLRVSGGGMPPVSNITHSYALVDGGLWQRTVARPRLVTLSLFANGSTLEALLAIRRSLIDALNGHVADSVQLRYYYNDADYIYLNCVYDGGLEGEEQQGFFEWIGIRLLAVDPFWYDNGTVTGALDPLFSVAACHGVGWRTSNGVLSSMDGGLHAASIDVTGLTRIDNKIQAWGVFTEAGSTPAHVDVLGGAEWDGLAWSILDPWTSLAGYDYGGYFGVACQGPGYIYISGRYYDTTHALKLGVWKYDGTTWTWILGNDIYAMAVSPSGVLWAASGQVGGIGVEYYSAGWNLVTPLAAVGSYQSIAISPTGTVYVGGDFAVVDGVAAASVAQYNPTTDTWAPLGNGLDDLVYSVVLGPDGLLYAGGVFLHSGTEDINLVAVWNGVKWSPLGDGLTGLCLGLVWSDDIGLVAFGDCHGSGTRLFPSHAAFWKNNQWIDLGIGAPAGAAHNLQCMSILGNDVVVGGEWDNVVWSSGGVVNLNNAGSANAYPVLVLNGPGPLHHVFNYTTNQRLDFNLTLATGEILTIDFRQGVKTITSNFRGNMLSSLVAGSLIDWHLRPGPNSVSVWNENVGGSGTFSFTQRYWSSDMTW